MEMSGRDQNDQSMACSSNCDGGGWLAHTEGSKKAMANGACALTRMPQVPETLQADWLRSQVAVNSNFCICRPN